MLPRPNAGYRNHRSSLSPVAVVAAWSWWHPSGRGNPLFPATTPGAFGVHVSPGRGLRAGNEAVRAGGALNGPGRVVLVPGVASRALAVLLRGGGVAAQAAALGLGELQVAREPRRRCPARKGGVSAKTSYASRAPTHLSWHIFNLPLSY